MLCFRKATRPCADIDLVMQTANPHDGRMGDGFQTDAIARTAVLSGAESAIPVIDETTDAMEIHKPKPIHNWREFFGEIGIIVIGVLLALAGEQTVEALHHRSQVAELSEALNVELSHNLAVLQDMVELKPCIDQRLTEIDKWSRSVADGRPVQLAGEFGRLPGQIFLTAIWRSTGRVWNCCRLTSASATHASMTTLAMAIASETKFATNGMTSAVLKVRQR